MKKDIKRKDLKSNFLKQTILRLDYDYLFEEDIEKIRKELNYFLISREYRMNSKTLSQFNVNFDIEKMNNYQNGVDVNIKSKEEYASFINNKGNIVIDITRNFATMTVDYEKNIEFENIIEVFSEVKKIVQAVREKIALNRIGIRKINMYFLENIENINKYFEEKLFSFNDLIKNEDIILKKQLDTYKYDRYKVNQNSEIQTGIVTNKQTKEEKQVYRITLDIDVYDDVMENNDVNLEKMNLIIFDIYKSNLKEKFLEELKNENYQNKELYKL